MKWVVAVALAGCFGKPGFAQRDAPTVEDDARDASDATDATDTGACMASKPSAAGMTVNLDPGDTTATFLDNSVIGFGNAFNRYPMVDRLIVNGQDLVATPETGCNLEDRVGIAVYPVYNIGPEPPAGAGTHMLENLQSGPAFTLLRTHWTYPLPGECVATQGAGHTTWAIFPDGKVVRNDAITPSDNGTLTAGIAGCNCPGALNVMGFAVTSYTTFEASRLAGVTRADDLADVMMVPNTSTAARGACARGTNSGAVAVWWDRPDNNDPPTPPTRLRRASNMAATPPHEIFAFVYDMVAATPQTMTIAGGAGFGIRTHMLLSGGGRACTDLIEDVESFAANNQIMIRPLSGAMMPIDPTFDGVFADARVQTEPVEITGTMPPGFSVQLSFPTFSAVSTNRAADRVIWQRNPDGTFHLFFRDNMSSGTPITVTPECGS